MNTRKGFAPLVIIFLVVVAVAMIFAGRYLYKNNNSFGFGTSQTNLAAALNFVPGTCYKDGIFECTDFAYEYCRVIGPSIGMDNCKIFLLNSFRKGYNGHALNIISAPLKDGTVQYTVIEPQNSGKSAKVAQWVQGAKKMVIPPATAAILTKVFGSEIGYKSTDTFDSTHYDILDGDALYSTYREKIGQTVDKEYWSAGWFAANDLRALTDKMIDANYHPNPEGIESCAALQGQPCDFTTTDSPYGTQYYSAKYPYQISQSPKIKNNIDYAGTVCINRNKFPITAACINNKMTLLTPNSAPIGVPVTAKITTSSVCPLSGSADDPNPVVKFKVSSPQLGPNDGTLIDYNSYTYKIHLYIIVNGKTSSLAEEALWNPGDESTVDFTRYLNETNPHKYIGYDVYGVITVYSKTDLKFKNPVLTTKSDTIHINVGPGGCNLGIIHSDFPPPRGYNFTCAEQQINRDMSFTPSDLASATYRLPAACPMGSVTITNPDVINAYGYVIEPATKTDSDGTTGYYVYGPVIRVPATKGNTIAIPKINVNGVLKDAQYLFVVNPKHPLVSTSVVEKTSPNTTTKTSGNTPSTATQKTTQTTNTNTTNTNTNSTPTDYSSYSSVGSYDSSSSYYDSTGGSSSYDSSGGSYPSYSSY